MYTAIKQSFYKDIPHKMNSVTPSVRQPSVRHAREQRLQSATTHPPNQPGVLETMASALRPVSKLMSDDLPTFERPMTANSGYPALGQSWTFTLLLTNSADLTLVCFGCGRTICEAAVPSRLLLGPSCAAESACWSPSSSSSLKRLESYKSCSQGRVLTCAHTQTNRLPGNQQQSANSSVASNRRRQHTP